MRWIHSIDNSYLKTVLFLYEIAPLLTALWHWDAAVHCAWNVKYRDVLFIVKIIQVCALLSIWM